MERIQIEKATKEHIDEVIQLRMNLLGEVTSIEDEEALKVATREYVEEAFENDTFISYIATVNEEVVGGSGLVFFKRPPYPGNLKGSEAYILNIYTSPSYRGQGIARKLLQNCMKECKKRGVRRIWLHATEEGRSMYTKVGFSQKDNEMEYFFESEVN
jgi:ribosomal protein S18 acetylase RimI-like enzyme